MITISTVSLFSFSPISLARYHECEVIQSRHNVSYIKHEILNIRYGIWIYQRWGTALWVKIQNETNDKNIPASSKQKRIQSPKVKSTLSPCLATTTLRGPSIGNLYRGPSFFGFLTCNHKSIYECKGSKVIRMNRTRLQVRHGVWTRLHDVIMDLCEDTTISL